MTPLAGNFRMQNYYILFGNTDDHFRNHGFLLTPKGWTLSPAYDINPEAKSHQCLLIDAYTEESDINALLSASEKPSLHGWAFEYWQIYFRNNFLISRLKKSSSGRPSGPTMNADVIYSPYSSLNFSNPEVSSALLLLTSMATNACPFFST